MPNNIPTSVHFLVCSRSSPHFRAQLFVCREDCLQVLDGPFALPSRCRSINTFEVGGGSGGRREGGSKKTKVHTHTHTHTQRKRFPWICMRTSLSLSQPLRHPSVPPSPITLITPTNPPLPHTHTLHPPPPLLFPVTQLHNSGERSPARSGKHPEY